MVKLRVPSAAVAATDALFVLFSLENAGHVHGNLKMQKVGFFSQLRLLSAGLRWPSFRFYRWEHGPFSQNLAAAFQELRTLGFVSADRHRCSARGRYVLDIAIPALRQVSENEPIFQVVDPVFERCRHQTGGALKDESYSIRWTYRGREDVTMAEIPHGVDIVVPSDEQKGLVVPVWVSKFVADELAASDGELAAAERRLPEIRGEALAGLSSTVTGA